MRQNTVYDIWNKVLFTTDCWEWLGGKDKDGYGQFCLNYKNIRTHRVSYELYKGKISNNLTIDHLCRNPSCVNPEHLEAVTMRENVLRGDTLASKNHNKTHCIRGHEFNEKNTYFYKNHRRCNECHRLNEVKRRNI